MLPGSTDKRFARHMALMAETTSYPDGQALTPAQAANLERLA